MSTSVDLIIRSMQESDIPACVALARGHRAYPEPLLAKLPRFWRRLLRDEALVSAVVERSRGKHAELIAFGASVFATDGWMMAASRADEPYLTARTIHHELASGVAILRPKAVAQANRAGLNALILHCCEARTGMSDEERRALRFRIMDAFLTEMRGYHVKAVLQEFWDELEPSFIVHGWGRVLSDYGRYFERQGERVPPIGSGPILVGLTREDAMSRPGDIMAPIFTYAPPRIGFSAGEQRVLRQALLARTDMEMSRFLRIALPTVKARWRSIYDRVGRVMADVLPPVDCSHSQQSRRQEKRRRLLEYLRRHPEELRPTLAQHAISALARPRTHRSATRAGESTR